MSSFNATISWTAPIWEQCNFTNCSLYAKFASTIYQLEVVIGSIENRFGEDDLCTAQPDAMYSYLLSGLPLNYSKPNRSEATLWYQLNCNESESWAQIESFGFISNMFSTIKSSRSDYESPFEFCNSELQSELHVQGNADIAGNGVSLSLWHLGHVHTYEWK